MEIQTRKRKQVDKGREYENGRMKKARKRRWKEGEGDKDGKDNEDNDKHSQRADKKKGTKKGKRKGVAKRQRDRKYDKANKCSKKYREKIKGTEDKDDKTPRKQLFLYTPEMNYIIGMNSNISYPSFMLHWQTLLLSYKTPPNILKSTTRTSSYTFTY